MAVFLLGAIPVVVLFCFIVAVLLLQLEASVAKQQPLPTYRLNFEDLDRGERDAA